MLLSVQPTKIDISDQNSVLLEMETAFDRFTDFMNKMKPAWDDMDAEEQKAAIASGKYPLIAYGQTMQAELNKWFKNEG